MYRFSNSNVIIADTKLDTTLGHSGPTRTCYYAAGWSLVYYAACYYAVGCKYAPLIVIG
jgi:hypothetical protein